MLHALYSKGRSCVCQYSNYRKWQHLPHTAETSLSLQTQEHSSKLKSKKMFSTCQSSHHTSPKKLKHFLSPSKHFLSLSKHFHLLSEHFLSPCIPWKSLPSLCTFCSLTTQGGTPPFLWVVSAFGGYFGETSWATDPQTHWTLCFRLWLSLCTCRNNSQFHQSTVPQYQRITPKTEQHETVPLILLSKPARLLCDHQVDCMFYHIFRCLQ